VGSYQRIAEIDFGDEVERLATGAAGSVLTARAFDEKVESLIVDSHDGANQIQDPHWCKGGQ
jgi:hypothetical protein